MDSKKNTIDSLIEQGQANGRLTTKEITDALEELDFDVDQINSFYDRCEALNIEIVEDMNAAFDRSRSIAAVENGKRFPYDIPCKIDGKCHDCRAPQRVCNALVVLWGPMMGMETEVVLIDEELGM